MTGNTEDTNADMNTDTNADTNHTLNDRERQYQIDHITYAYVEAYRRAEQGELGAAKPRIEDYCARYPQYAAELIEWALYWHTIGQDFESLDGGNLVTSEEDLSEGAKQALAWIRAQGQKTAEEGDREHKG